MTEVINIRKIVNNDLFINLIIGNIMDDVSEAVGKDLTQAKLAEEIKTTTAKKKAGAKANADA